MIEEIKVLPVEAEEFYKDRGDITDTELLNFKPLNEELSLSVQRQTIEGLNQQIRNLRIELEKYALDYVIWFPESWYVENGEKEGDAEWITLSSAMNKIQKKLSELERRLTKAGL